MQCWPGVHQIRLTDPMGTSAGLLPPDPGPPIGYSAFHLVTYMVLQRNNEQETYLSTYL